MSNIIINILTITIGTHWAIISVYTIFGLIGYIFYKETHKLDEFEKTEINIVSKASKDLKEILFDVIAHNAEMFKNYRLNVIIDEGCDLMKELYLFNKKYDNVRLIIVPSKFKCKAIAKGRAMEFFIRNYTESYMWYAFLDDDNKVLDNKFLKEISYYSMHGYVACNGILYPRLGKSRLAFIADTLRYFDDLTIFRVGTGLLKKPLNGFHGELLVVSGSTLQEITFDRETITEDFAFAREIVKIGKKTWQSETKISIQSPHSMVDFIRQRNRWYRGISKDIQTADWKMKLFAGVRVLDWKIGILGSWLIFPIWFSLPIPLYLSLFNIIGAGYYYISYIYGAMRSSESDIVRGILSIPIYGILETIAPHIHIKKENEFTIINK